jgi:hypothetical protein
MSVEFMVTVLFPKNGQGEPYRKYQEYCKHELISGSMTCSSNNKNRLIYLEKRQLDLQERGNKSLEELLLRSYF